MDLDRKFSHCFLTVSRSRKVKWLNFLIVIKDSHTENNIEIQSDINRNSTPMWTILHTKYKYNKGNKVAHTGYGPISSMSLGKWCEMMSQTIIDNHRTFWVPPPLSYLTNFCSSFRPIQSNKLYPIKCTFKIDNCLV